MSNLKVWWIPQVPMKAFEVEVETLPEAVRLLNTLAKYDIFQFENKVKPDYCNAGGVVMFEKESGEWVDWYDEETGMDDPEQFVREYLE